MTKHFSFFFSVFSFCLIFFNSLVVSKKFTSRITGKKISLGRLEGNKQFFFFGIVSSEAFIKIF